MHEHPDVVNLMPPGTYLETLDHPSGESRKIELAVFKEHRFAFYFWNRWNNTESNLPPPTLVTIDWHRDLAPPSDEEKKGLDHLDLKEEDKVSTFIWSNLNTHNDSHLLSAAYRNIVGDILLLKNYGNESQSVYKDCQENNHRILEFKTTENLENNLSERLDRRFILDLDLDFFIKGKVYSHQLNEVEPYSESEIAEIIDPYSALFQQLFRRLEGITIATEPRYCGGILKSNKILRQVMGQLFTDELEWKHLMQ
ncbi:hypothetical protein G3570_09365 [Balneolaceae bacterium YR4-1]|uniref:Uncharacterized protein n=1 Tax=Halalkalibaculum roseum TaxID=2709311 RepID=A0A6M1SV52_9BACT|nr:UPF0489 family protein [Halalkalibaculum roseum]NGP76840.1 hypothetical protein [Halalkalibaculum roseum]